MSYRYIRTLNGGVNKKRKEEKQKEEQQREQQREQQIEHQIIATPIEMLIKKNTILTSKSSDKYYSNEKEKGIEMEAGRDVERGIRNID